MIVNDTKEKENVRAHGIRTCPDTLQMEGTTISKVCCYYVLNAEGSSRQAQVVNSIGLCLTE